MRYFLLGFFLLIFQINTAQEFNTTVTVDAAQTGQTQLTIFKTLQTEIQDFMNNTSWTRMKIKPEDRINCNMFITVTKFDSNDFSATIQIQSTRPVFGSTFSTPVFTFKDNQFNFRYTEYEPLRYSRNTFTSALISNLSFYAYTMLGYDADTFELNGGEDYHQEAKQIVDMTQQNASGGWTVNDGNQSKFRLNADLISSNFGTFREAIYNYHRLGLDLMHTDAEQAKKNIANVIMMIKEVNTSRPNNAPVRTFFDTKALEIEQIFSGGPQISIVEVVQTLKTMAPVYNKNWNNIKY
ncbi:DUF4835 family protein [Mesonia sp. K7]|uniref:type IX secretion system protein PorD n=1 Tax=Mesonia sp. K7 TaxID=2218606 RepID=UPI000DA8C56E|nr:DUF4835 family protein [Mesonia sp. K7]PZD79564.1 DUF4835 domain-containing protein [Mesonia sp. K7]